MHNPFMAFAETLVTHALQMEKEIRTMQYSIPLVTDDAIGVVYRFMTESSLFNSEVTLVSSNQGEIGFYTRDLLPSEDEFRAVCSNMILSAVASFDEEGSRRVNISVGADMAVLSVYDPADEEARDALVEKIK